MKTTQPDREQLYRDYRDKVCGYIRSKLGSVQDAEDLTDDVFVKIFEKLDTFDESKAALSTWIYTITRNTLTDYFRTRRTFDEIPETLADDTRLEERLLSAETLDALADALQALDERQRDIILLRFYFGKTLRQIAAQMGISYGYIKVLQNKAFARLRESLGDQ